MIRQLNEFSVRNRSNTATYHVQVDSTTNKFKIWRDSVCLISVHPDSIYKSSEMTSWDALIINDLFGPEGKDADEDRDAYVTEWIEAIDAVIRNNKK